MQNVVGPTLVAMATKFGLGTEIQSLTLLSLLVGLFTMQYFDAVGCAMQRAYL